MKNNFYRLLLLPLLLLAAWGARAQAPTWQNAYPVPVTGPSGNSVVQGVATNAAGDIFIAGSFVGNATFGSTTLTSNSGTEDMFVAKWNGTANTWAWAVSGGGAGTDQAFGIAVNGNNVYVCGNYSTSTATISGSSLAAYNTDGTLDMFVAKYYDNGTSVTSKGALRGGGTSSDRGNAIAVNSSTGTVYVTGYHGIGTGTVLISGSTLTGAGAQDIFVARYTDAAMNANSSLAEGGALRAGGTSSGEQGQGIAVNSNGTIYVTGAYGTNGANFSGTALTSGGSRDMFLARYTDSGSALAFSSVVAAGGSGADTGFGITTNGTTVYVAGYYTSSSIGFGNSVSLTNSVGTTTTNDMFVVKYTDTNGTLTANSAAGSSNSANDDFAYGVAAVGTTVYVTGFYNVSASISGTSLTSAGDNDAFVAKYTDSGSLTPNGAISGGGTGIDQGRAIARLGGQVVVAGTVNPSTSSTFGNTTIPAGSEGFFARVGTPPTTVTSIVRASANPTNAGTVNYTVTFGASVTGLTASNFSLTVTGSISGASVGTPVSTGTGSTWTVPVTTGTGSGTLTLNLANATNLSPGLSTTLPFAGEAYTIDKTAPTVAISSTAGASGTTTNTTPIPFTVTFSENVTGFVAGDVTVTNGTVTGGTINGASPGTVYTFTVTPTTPSTATTVNVAAGVVQDAVGNTNTAAPAAYSLTYQQPSVTVTSVTRLALSPTATATVTYRVVFSGSVNGVSPGNFTATSTGGAISGASVTGVTGSGTTYTVTVNTGTGDGTLRLDVVNSTNTSPTITNVPYTAGEEYTITKSFAAAPILRIQAAGSASNNSDVTAFVDVVQVLQSGTSTAVANGIQNGSFETNNVPAGGFLYQRDGVVAAPWTFNSNAGVSRNSNGGFGSTAADGDAVAFLQSLTGGNNSGNGSVTQNLAVPTGSYQVRFRAIQRNYTSLDQRLNVFVNDVFVGNIQSNNIPTYDTFTSAAFNVTAPALTATVSTTSASPTSTAPIPFSVTFSQSVGSTFTASDVTVVGGTVTSGSFSGSGAGPYTFTVTPGGAGNVTVSLAASMANDANNTQNSTSNPVSVQYQLPTTTAPVVTSPANNSTVNGTPTFAGTAPTGSTVTIYLAAGSGAAQAIGTTTATGGSFSFTPATALASGSYAVYATAQANGSTVSTNSNTTTFTVDATAPTVLSINRQSPAANPTNATSLTYRVTFSEGVTGVTANDFSLTSTGSASGTVSAVAAVSSSVYDVTVSSTSGNGTLRLDLNSANTGIADLASNGIATGGYTSGQSYTLDNTAPSVTISTTSASPTSTSPIPFTVTFSESVTGFAQGDLTLTNGTVTSFSGSGTTYNLTITPGATGTVTVSVAQNVAQDAVGNGNLASNSVSVQYNQPVTATPVLNFPTNGIFVRTSRPEYRGTAAPGSLVAIYRALGSGNAVLTDTTFANPLGNFHKFSNAALADGQYSVYVTATTDGQATSANSNANTFTVDTTVPTVTLTSSTVANSGTTSTSPVLFTATFSEAVTGFTSADIQVSGGSVTSGPTAGSGNTYTFQVTPSGAGTVTAQVLANAAQDRAGNNSTASASYSFTFNAPTIAVSPATGTLPSGTQGTAYSVTFSASGGSNSYSYAISGTPPQGLSLSGSTLSGTPTTSGTFNFRITATDNSAAPGPYSGFRDYTITIAAPAVTAVSWTGSVSTDWFTAGNWTPSQVPDATINVTIPSAPSGGRFPVISGGTASSRALTLASGASLRMSDGLLDAQGSWTNNGSFVATGGTVQLGQQTGSIVGSSTTTFWNLTITGNAVGLNTSAGIEVRRLLTTNRNLNTNGNPVTLLSDATGTAMAVNPGASAGVQGTSVAVQRYIDPSQNPGPGYRHLSSPTVSLNNSQGTQFADLQTANFTPVVNSAYNTSATPGTTQPFPNIFGYDQSRLATVSNNYSAFDKGFYSPAALSDRMSSGFGYAVNISANQTLTFRGGLGFGDLLRNLSRNAAGSANEADAGWQLLGNPYPSPYDYSLQAASDRQNLDAAIYVLQSTSQYAGQYRAIVNGVGGNAILPLGQAFFARVSEGQTSGSIIFRNANRVTTYQNPAYLRTTETRPLVQLTLQGTGKVLTDDVNVYFEAGATAGVESEFDAVKLPNPTGLNLSTSAQGQQLAIDGQAALGSIQRVVPLVVGVPAAGSYTLNAAQLLNLDAVPVYLRDLLSGAVVDLRQQPSYQFTVSNATTAVQGRFELVFSPQQPLATLPAALAQQVSVYPNPAATQVTLELPQSLSRQPVTVALVDALGRVVRQQALPVGVASHTLLLNGLSTGMYALRITTEAGLLVKKLVIK